MVSLYDMSIPVYVKAIESLIGVLKKGEKWADENKVDHSKLIEARLAPDMNVCEKASWRDSEVLLSSRWSKPSPWLSKSIQLAILPRCVHIESFGSAWQLLSSIHWLDRRAYLPGLPVERLNHGRTTRRLSRSSMNVFKRWRSSQVYYTRHSTDHEAVIS